MAADSKTDDVVRIVSDIGGLHATSPMTPYLSLFARANHLAREDLGEELYVKKSLGRIRYVRKTMYILPRELIPAAFAATKDMVGLASKRYCKYRGVTRDRYEETSKMIMGLLGGRGMTAREIAKELQAKASLSPILNLMCDEGLLVRGIPKNGWKSNVHTYYPFREYFPGLDLHRMDKAEAREWLVKQYLASFGPATENDAAWWTGFPMGEVREMLQNLEIIPLKISGLDDAYIALRSDEAHIRAVKARKELVVNLLPSLDPYIMGYRDRERYVEARHYDMVFDRSGNSASTVLLDGRVVGVWDFADGAEPTVKTFLFEEVEKGVAGEVHSKAREVGRFIAGKEVRVKECDSMVPLTRRTAGIVMTPLRDC